MREAKIPRKWQGYYRRLSQLRTQLVNESGAHSRDAAEEQPVFSLHMADAGSDAYDRDLALGMLSSEQDAVFEIDEALNRMRNGTYGICEATGKPIPRPRLEAIPWARFTAAAEKGLEQEGAIRLARLGPRESVARELAEEEEEEVL